MAFFARFVAQAGAVSPFPRPPLNDEAEHPAATALFNLARGRITGRRGVVMWRDRSPGRFLVAMGVLGAMALFCFWRALTWPGG